MDFLVNGARLAIRNANDHWERRILLEMDKQEASGLLVGGDLLGVWWHCVGALFGGGPLGRCVRFARG